MGFWDTLIKPFKPKAQPVRELPQAYSAIYPIYEVQTPQYPYPSTYNLARTGYRLNQLVYACVTKRALAIADATIAIYDNSSETDNELDNHPAKLLLRNPNPAMTEEQFWQITEINLLIAGFCAWEIERNNAGDPLNLWPMRSDWCSFYRGQGKPIRAIRYQPYGLPPADIDIENVLLFQYYDPLFPLLKGLSPSAVALGVVEVDNGVSLYLNNFIKKGAAPPGLLKTAQSLSDTEATRIRNRWKEAHGGADNWSEVAVLGSGTEYQAMGGAFSPGFAFQEIDGRDEARICMTFGVPPILIGAKVGLAASTYSNYAEARSAFYEETIVPEWRYLASEIREQLVPNYTGQPDDYWSEFDTSGVKALQEDRSLVWTRAVQGWQSNLLTRDEARGEAGLDPIDRAPVFFAEAMTPPQLEPTYQEQTQDFGAWPKYENTTSSGNEGEVENPTTEAEAIEAAEEQAKKAEAKQYRTFAQKRLAEGHPEKIADFRFRFLSAAEQAALKGEQGAQSGDTGGFFRDGLGRAGGQRFQGAPGIAYP